MATIKEVTLNGNSYPIETSRKRLEIAGNTPSETLEPNKLYVFTGTLTSLTLTLTPPSDSSVESEYHIFFETDANGCNVTWPSNLVDWRDGTAPTIQGGKHYEISIEEGLASFSEF